MTVREENSAIVLKCDDCSQETQNLSMNDLLVNAAMARWKVINDPDHGVQHFCQVCGQKTDHELAVMLRTELQRSGVNVPMQLDDEDGDAGFSMNLDDEVVSNAKARAGRLVPDMGAVNQTVKQKGEYSFGFNLEDDDNGRK